MRFTFAAFAIMAFSQAALLPSDNSYSELAADAFEYEPAATPAADATKPAAAIAADATKPAAAIAADATKPAAAPAAVATDAAAASTADAKPESDVKADTKKADEVKEAPSKDAAVKDSEKAKNILSSADTKLDTTPKGSQFSTIEAEIDIKIKGQTSQVEKAVASVKDLNKKADDKIGEAKKAVEAKAQAGVEKTNAEKDYAAQVKVVQQAAKKADEQSAANKAARDAKKRAVEAQVKQAEAIDELTAAMRKAIETKDIAEQFGADRQTLIDYTIKEAAKMTSGTVAEQSALKNIVEEAAKGI